MVLHDLKWSSSEKRAAREAFNSALKSVLAKVMAEFKRRAAAAATPSDLWEIEDFYAPATPGDRRNVRLSLLAASSCLCPSHS